MTSSWYSAVTRLQLQICNFDCSSNIFDLHLVYCDISSAILDDMPCNQWKRILISRAHITKGLEVSNRNLMTTIFAAMLNIYKHPIRSKCWTCHDSSPDVPCGHRSPVNSPHKRPVTRSFDVFFDLCLNKRLSKQSWGWWFETLPRPLWRHSNATVVFFHGWHLNVSWANIWAIYWGTIVLRAIFHCYLVYHKLTCVRSVSSSVCQHWDATTTRLIYWRQNKSERKHSNWEVITLLLQ